MREWISLVEDLNSTGNPAPLLRASHHCEDCEKVAQGVAAIYQAGGWIHSAGYTVLDPVQIKSKTGKATVLKFDLRVGASESKQTSSSSIVTTEEATGHIEVTVGRINGELRMLEFYRVPE